jgi:DNA repair photolyase
MPQATKTLEVEAKSLLLRRRRVDSWFLSALGMNLYRGCTHDCAYCDGRAEKYQVTGEFGREVTVKTNAPALLRRELSAKRRVPLRRSYVFLGGGVGDSYQPLEAPYGLTRQALEILLESGWPVHILTKSSLVERDFDLLARSKERAGAIVSMSLSTARDEIGAVFEPGCARPSRRLETLARAKAAGIATGVYLMPVIPFVTDTAELLDETLARVAAVGVDFVMFGGMTLKVGRQQEHFMRVLGEARPELVAKVARLYPGDPWGGADRRYYAEVERRFVAAARRHGVRRRMPARLFRTILGQNDLVAVLLEGLDYLRRSEGRGPALWRAARAVAELKEPVAAARDSLRRNPAVSGDAMWLIDEILDTGTAREYDEAAGA